MSSSSDAGPAFCWIGRVANITVESCAGETGEGFGCVKIVSGVTSASTVTGVVDESSVGITVDTDGRIDLNVKSSSSGTGSWTASGGWVVGVGVLEGSDVGEERLCCGVVPGECDGEDSIGNSGVDVEPSHDVAGEDASSNGRGDGGGCEVEDLVVEDESVDLEFDIVVGVQKEVGFCYSSDCWLVIKESKLKFNS